MSKRTTVTLEPADELALSVFSDPTRPEHAVLVEWAEQHGLTFSGSRSESAVIRTLLRVGAEALRAQALDYGYAALAASFSGEDHAEARELRRRYVNRTDQQFTT